MENYVKTLEIRWADLDPNFHVLHSKYFDFGAYCRMSFLVDNGITPVIMQAQHFGAVIFREECVFKKEIVFADKVSINLKIQKATHDFSRWSMIHEINKNENTLAAVIHVDAAWIDTSIRRLTMPPAMIESVFAKAPRTEDFIFYTR